MKIDLIQDVADRVHLLKLAYFRGGEVSEKDGYSISRIDKNEIELMFENGDISELEKALYELRDCDFWLENQRVRTLDYIRDAFYEVSDIHIVNDKIVKLTGLPVSEKMGNILNELKSGNYVDYNEIENTPELVLARTCVNNSVSTIMLSGREKLRKGVIEKLCKRGSAEIDSEGKVTYNGNVRNDSRLDIVIGLPASGKSSALVDVLSAEYHSRVIDNDEAKKLIPEFNNGWGGNAVHDESQLIERMVFQASLSKGDNIVLPKIGSDIRKMLTIIRQARDMGYKVNVHYVELNRNKALGRMLDRFIDEGRFMEPKLIEKYHNNLEGNKISNVYYILKEGGMIDGYSKWDNDVERGERPILIETNCEGRYIEEARPSRNYNVNNGNSRESGGGGLSSISLRNRTQSGTGENGYGRDAEGNDKGDVSRNRKNIKKSGR